jgi:mono/diheme cytochrome c family protein
LKTKLFFPFLLVVLTITACASAANTPQAIETLEPVPSEFVGLTNPLGAEAATEGAQVFHNFCETCHGPEGHGDGPAGQMLDPKPKNLADLQATAGDDYLFWRISAGKPGTSMVSWNGILTDEQVWQTVAFIRTLK